MITFTVTNLNNEMYVSQTYKLYTTLTSEMKVAYVMKLAGYGLR